MISTSTPAWKRNLEALGSFLGPTGPTAPSSAGAGPVTDTGSRLLQALASEGESGAPLDAIAERIGAKFRESADAAQALEAARLILIERTGVVPVLRLTQAGWQIANAAAPARAR